MIALAALLKLDLIHHRKKKRRDKAGRRTPPALTAPATVLVEKLNRNIPDFDEYTVSPVYARKKELST